MRHCINDKVFYSLLVIVGRSVIEIVDEIKNNKDLHESNQSFHWIDIEPNEENQGKEKERKGIFDSNRSSDFLIDEIDDHGILVDYDRRYSESIEIQDSLHLYSFEDLKLFTRVV